jgi:hypothetical protein
MKFNRTLFNFVSVIIVQPVGMSAVPITESDYAETGYDCFNDPVFRSPLSPLPPQSKDVVQDITTDAHSHLIPPPPHMPSSFSSQASTGSSSSLHDHFQQFAIAAQTPFQSFVVHQVQNAVMPISVAKMLFDVFTNPEIPMRNGCEHCRRLYLTALEQNRALIAHLGDAAAHHPSSSSSSSHTKKHKKQKNNS